MTRDRLRQWLTLLLVLATIVINGLANALPFNNLTTAEISDRFQVYFVPAGYVFAIWGLIYLGLIAFAVFQALPASGKTHAYAPSSPGSSWPALPISPGFFCGILSSLCLPCRSC